MRFSAFELHLSQTGKNALIPDMPSATGIDQSAGEKAGAAGKLALQAKMGVLLANAVRPLPYFRGRHRVLNALLPQKRWEYASIYGIDMWLDLSDFVQRNVFIGSYEVEETNWVKDLLRPGMTFVDVGANIGYYSALASSLVGREGKVFAFEPNPSVYRQLRSWIESSGIPQVHSFQIAMSNAAGNLTLFVPPESEHNNNANVVRGQEGYFATSVPAFTLDSYLKKLNSGIVNLLKLDVEGYEPCVLEGAEATIRDGRIRAIMAEFHPAMLDRAGTSPEALSRWLAERGFKTRKSTPTNRLLVYDP